MLSPHKSAVNVEENHLDHESADHYHGHTKRRTKEPGPAPHSQNASGDFYVANAECMACGALEAQAPTLMSHERGDQGRHCFFARQPSTKAETDAAILSVYISCCGAVRYGGQDREILTRLAELGAAGSCDYELDDEPNPTSLSRATFEFEVADKPGTERATVSRQIMKYLADYFAASPSKDHRVMEFRCSEAQSSFRYEWGYGGNPSLYSETFYLNHMSQADGLCAYPARIIEPRVLSRPMRP